MGKKANPPIHYSAICEDIVSGEVFDSRVISEQSPVYWPGELLTRTLPTGQTVRIMILGVIFREIQVREDS